MSRSLQYAKLTHPLPCCINRSALDRLLSDSAPTQLASRRFESHVVLYL